MIDVLFKKTLFLQQETIRTSNIQRVMNKSYSTLFIFRGIYRLSILFLWLFLGLPFQIIVWPLSPLHPLRQKLTQLIFKGTCFALGIKVVLKGKPVQKGPCLFLSNHISYLDILVLGTIFKASFVSKADVQKWPIFGLYATLQGTVFIERTKRTIKKQKSALLNRLQKGGSLILFPEGTTHTGIHVLPFKSSLLESVEDPTLLSHLKVQPLSLTYTHLSGLPLGRNGRVHYAWFGKLSLLPHVWSIVSGGPLCIQIECHQTLYAEDFLCRKKIAAFCFKEVQRGISTTFGASLPNRAGSHVHA